MEYVVTAEYGGELLRSYLKNKLSLSRALVTELKQKQGIKVNGVNVTVRYVLSEGDVVGCVVSAIAGDASASGRVSNETETKLIQTAGVFLGKQMEG